PPRWNVGGAPIGIGGLAVTAAFVALHGVRPGLLLGVAPAAIIYLWLRARTGSLLAPIAAHLLWNLSLVLMYR
ncbi:MAG TPA: CPBP family intramembrane glutamic endopeptidase, partial [Burkholderiaceae bacterium]|nr:CPBP family intramembrane glutamic endopeptidase [Burkholderiaceae bacterium]